MIFRQECPEMDVVPGHDLGQAFPDFVINYYEQCAPFSVRHPVGRIPRPAPEVIVLNMIIIFMLFTCD